MTTIYNIVKKDATIVGRNFDFYINSMSNPQVKLLYLNDVKFDWEVYLVNKKDAKLSADVRKVREGILDSFNDNNIHYR